MKPNRAATEAAPDVSGRFSVLVRLRWLIKKTPRHLIVLNSVENTINIVGKFTRIIVNNSCKTNHLFVENFCKPLPFFVLRFTSILDNVVAAVMPRRRALSLYDQIEPDTAKAMLQHLQRDPDYLNALRLVEQARG